MRFVSGCAWTLGLAFLAAPAPVRGQDPADPPARSDYGYCLQQGRSIYQKTRNAYRAVAWFRRALRVDPDGVEAIRGAGIAEAIAENDEEALVYLAEAARLAPGDPVVWYWLGRVHRRNGRMEAAHAALERAGRLPAPAGFEWVTREATAALDTLRREDPELAGRAAERELSPGPATTLLLRYWGASTRDANMRDLADARMRQPSSADAGAPLEPRLLRLAAFDAAGFPARITPTWIVSGGLRIESGPADTPPRIFAGRWPSTREEIVVRDAAGGMESSTTLAVLGPATALTVISSQPRLGPGQRTHLEARISDGAGNLLYHRLTRWSASSAAGPADDFLVRSESLVVAENDFEPHRNVFRIPEQNPPREATYSVQCLEPETGTLGNTLVVGLTEPAPIAHGGHGPLPWLEDLDAAREVATRDHRMILADFSAEW